MAEKRIEETAGETAAGRRKNEKAAKKTQRTEMAEKRMKSGADGAGDGRDLEQRCREAYQRGILKEMEREIYQRTLKKAEVITRSMRPGEKA